MVSGRGLHAREAVSSFTTLSRKQTMLAIHPGVAVKDSRSVARPTPLDSKLDALFNGFYYCNPAHMFMSLFSIPST